MGWPPICRRRLMAVQPVMLARPPLLLQLLVSSFSVAMVGSAINVAGQQTQAAAAANEQGHHHHWPAPVQNSASYQSDEQVQPISSPLDHLPLAAPPQPTRRQAKKIMRMGLIVSPDDDEGQRLESSMRKQLDEINGRLSEAGQSDFQLELISTNLVGNPIEMSEIVCRRLLGGGGVSAVIVDTDRHYIASIASISFTLGLYSIPVLGTTLRGTDSSLFNKNLHSSYVSLIPPNSHQADVWYHLMAKLGFKQAIVLTSAQNRDLFIDLMDKHKSSTTTTTATTTSGGGGGGSSTPPPPSTTSDEFKIEAIIEHDAAAFATRQLSWLHMVESLEKLLKDSICRVFLVHAQSKEDAQLFVDVLEHLKMTGDGVALILSEDTVQVAREHGLRLPSGAISTRLADPPSSREVSSRMAYALDALEAAAQSVIELQQAAATNNYQQQADDDPTTANSREPPNSCQLSPSLDWTLGLELYAAILRQTFVGRTGLVAFDDNGDRYTATYELLNIVDTQPPTASEHSSDNNNSRQLGGQTLRPVGAFKSGLVAVGGGGSQQDSVADGSKVELDIGAIQWPGGLSGQLISGVYVNRHLRILTLQEKPFVWVLNEQDCWLTKDTTTDRTNATTHEQADSHWRQLSLPCQRLNPTTGQRERFCCKGYCMDLLEEIARRLNFTFDLYLAPDDQYGQLEPSAADSGATSPTTTAAGRANSSGGSPHSSAVPAGVFSSSLEATSVSADDSSFDVSTTDANDDGRRNNHRNQQAGAAAAANLGPFSPRLKWTGLMGELVSRQADMAFAPLTITPQRAQAIDFSKPFKFHGFSILLRRAPKHTTLASFLQPFHNQLWILVIGVATHVVALALYLLDRYSTFGRFGQERHLIPARTAARHDDNPLHLSSSLWFSWSILLNSGVGEHTPKSLSGRVLGIFWSGFAMIVVASYTANLAAFLVLDSREETPTLSGIDDPRLRSGDLAFNFATVRGSAVDAYLQSQVEYINLYRKMEEFNFNNVDQSILALRSGSIDALIWDSTRLEWEVATDEKCSLGIAGELFGSSGYGIGLQKDSYWTKNVTTKLLELHESGFMIELDKKWIAAGGSGETAQNSGQQQQQQQQRQSADWASPAASGCERRNDDYPETLGIFNIAGVFILFAFGLLTSCGLILVERFCYKHRALLLQRQRLFWRRLKG